MMFWNHGGWGFGDWLMMSVFMVAIWGLILGLVVWLVRGFGPKRTQASAGSRTATGGADEVLSERFARGEIDEAELTSKRLLLHTTSGPSRSTGGA